MLSVKRILSISIPLLLLTGSIFTPVHAEQKTSETSSTNTTVKTTTTSTPTKNSKAKKDAKDLKKRRKKRKSRYGANYFPNIELTNQDGKKFKFYDDLIKDKVVSINFIFTSCENVCPLETARLKEVYKIVEPRLGKDLFMYSITVDPARDTPEKLKAYKEKFGIGDNWDFLTGNKKEIDALRTKLGLYIKDLDETLPNGQIDHNISLVMGNQKTGRWMKRSPYEDANVLATMFGDWLHNWKNKSTVKSVDYKHADNLATTYSDGEFLFRTRCLTCHSLGNGDGVGPDLAGIMKKRDRKWLTRWIMEPNVMLKEKDPIAIELLKKYNNINMPNLRMSKGDVNNLFKFFESRENPAPAKKVKTGIK